MTSRFLALSVNKRLAVLAVVGSMLVGAFVLARSASSPEFVPLFRGMEIGEVGAVTDALEAAGIESRLESGGSDVLVAEASLAQARVLLAQDGLPASGRPGLELFDKPSWGMTDFTQHVTYRRALEGELARTIGMLRGVQRAQVHLALPEASPLRRLEQAAEAAVVLVLKPNQVMAPDQVQGIAQLVSSSVERLPVERVAVLDESGRMLSRAASSGALGLTSDQLEIQRSVERHLSAKLEPIVAAVVGAGAARIQVTALLDFEQVEQTVEQYDPDGQVLQSEQRADPGDGVTDPSTQRVVNSTWLSSRRVERIVGAVGAIERLSVSVLLDEPSLAQDSTSRLARQEQLEALVRTAVGADSTRGDLVSVVAIPFVAPTPLLMPDTAASEPVVTPVALAGDFAMPVVALVLGILAFVLVMRLMRTGAPARAAASSLPAPTDDAHVPVAPGGDTPRVAPTPANLQLRNRLAQESVASPENAARVMRAWLAEGS